MDYRVPAYGVAAPVAKTSTKKIIIIVVVVVVVLFLILGAIAIALGVGLGVGLTRGNSDSSSSSSSVLSAPVVNCNYSTSTCGCASTKPSFLSSRIVNGYTATANSWPWIVALYINNGQSFCGGFLVSYKHVVTAAHCVNGVTPGTITVYAGIQKLSTRGSTGQSSVVSNVDVPSGFSSSTGANDIAVLTLKSPFTATTTVGLCCLSSDTSLPSVGEHGVIAGWGTTSSSSSTRSDDLLQGVIQVQSSSSSCSTSLSGIQFCAGYGGTDACFGDSGSPFMTNENNAWTCTGLVVGASGGCGANSLYTRVTAYQSYINGIVNG